jgi:hypothetical protein
MPTYPTDFEKGRVATSALQSKRIRAFCAHDPLLTLTGASLRTAWEALEVARANGYAPFSFVIPAGAYDNGDDRYEVGGTAGAFVPVTFSATGAGYTYNRVCWVVGTSNGLGGWNEENYVSYITEENPFRQLLAGQAKTYNFQIGTRGVISA